MGINIKKTYTENPFLDTLLYCIKQLAYNCLLKNENEAIKYETEESLKESEKFIYSINGNAGFDLYFTYLTEDMLIEAGIPEYRCRQLLNNKQLLEDDYPDLINKLIEICKKSIIDNYVEKNDYYRKITGKPPLGENGISLDKYYLEMLPDGEEIQHNYLHECTAEEGQLLKLYGVLDAIKLEHPEAEYIDYIPYGIDIYKARRSADKQIIYIKSCGIDIIDELFEEKFELARKFVELRVDSDAMEYNSEHYDAFLCIYILFLTINDCILELQDRIIKKDVLDARCIKFIFEMYGVPYFKNIKYLYAKI